MTTIGIGYSSSLEANRPPVAIITPVGQEAVVGSIVKLDGRASLDPEGDGLTYEWSFVQVPIGSQVEKAGFTELESDLSIVSFAPDIIGVYKIQLVVSDSNSLASEPFVAQIDTRVILVPYHQGYCPDASFIWNYLSDFWSKVDGREQVEVFWEGAIQVVAAEMLKVFQYDYNKSIRDIQTVIQKRWVHYDPAVVLDPDTTSFVLADDQAGLGADSVELDIATGLPITPQPHLTSFIGVPKSEGNLEVTNVGLIPSQGRILSFADRAFTLLRVSHSRSAVVHDNNGSLLNNLGVPRLQGSVGTFTAGMVGYKVNIITGSQAGTSREIITFVNSATVALDGLAWPASESPVEFTVVPDTYTHNAVVVDEINVPTNLKNKPWRLSATVLSTLIDFEENGVTAGDVIEVEVTRTDAGLTTPFFVQVTGVDRNRLGFSLNLEKLVNGESADGITQEDQVRMAFDLQVPGLFVTPEQTLIYSEQAGLIYSTLTSKSFKRKYYEKELTPETEIDVGAFKITVRPIQVIRNKRVPIDPGIVSIPVLQEYICQPQVSAIPGGKFIYKTMGGTVEKDREPVVALENLDYVVDDETTVRGLCNTVADDDLVELPYGDLLDRSVRSGDRLDIELFGRFETFTISQVIDAEHVRVIPAPPVTDTQLAYKLQRRVGGKFIRFIEKTFDPKRRAPVRLWAEVTYFDNNPTIEDNFGVLVGITQDDIEKANATVPYRSAVAGLMYALTTGSTIENLRLAAQILLGLPFTENAGIITEINPEYRRDDDGSPLLGRILVEARDTEGQPLGITNIYLYPRGRQLGESPGVWVDAVPAFQGVALNPVTGVEYVVGDAVKQFAPLTKGINIQEYLSQPEWFVGLVGQANAGLPLEIYHSFNVIINSDLVTASDIDIAAAFIKRAKPTYTKLKSVLLKEVEDLVEVDDEIRFKIIGKAFDQAAGSLPSAVKFDGGDLNETFMTIPGLMYQRLIEGDDLETDQATSDVVSALGGFVDPRPGLIESHDTPFVREGDVVVIPSGSNAGMWPVVSVNTDDGMTLDLGGAVFETIAPDPDPDVAPRQVFTIYRPIKNPIWWGTAAVVNGDDDCTVILGGLFSAGVAQGDIFVFQVSATSWSKQYVVVEVDVDGAQGFKVHTPITEASGSYEAAIVREPLTNSILGLGEPAFPAGGTQANVASGNALITFNATAAGLLLAQVNPGDVITDGVREFAVLRNEPQNNGLRVTPTPAFTDANLTVSIERRTRGLTTVSADILDRLPNDYLQLDLVLSAANNTDKLVTSNGSNQVNTQLSTDLADLGLRVGDYVVILEGADASVDDGHGPGVFMVFSFASNTQARLSRNMSSSGNRRYAIRKRKPHAEG